jgi:spore germination protein YaaH
VTIALAGIRALWPDHVAKVNRLSDHHRAKATHVRRYYRVRAGDTLASIAAQTHTPVARLRRLNPRVQPTALFIGQRLRLG